MSIPKIRIHLLLIRGNPIKKKVLVSLIAVVVVLASFLALTRGTKAVGWWTGGGGSWQARKMLTVTNNSSSNLSSESTVAVTIDTKSLYDVGKLQGDCDDLRIVYQPSSSVATEVTRHLVYPSGTTCSSSTTTKVFFKLQAALNTSTSSTDYYLYYKNPTASTPSSTDNAFDTTTSIDATLICPFDGSTTCAAGETPSTESGAVRYSGSKGAIAFGKYGVGSTGAFPNPGIGDKVFSIETWVYMDRYVNPATILRYQTGSNTFTWQVSSAGAVQLSGSAVFSSGTLSCGTVSLSSWTHLALVGDGTDAHIYLNGTDCGTTKALDGTLTWPSDIKLGSANSLISETFPGKFDEIRLSDIARYSGSFSTTTTAFIRDSLTKALYHFDENGDDPRNTGKAIDDSGNGNHITLTSLSYVSGLVGVDASTSDTGNVPRQSYAAHEGIFIEEGTTNKITNPSFDHGTYSTNWDAVGANLTASENTTAPYYKFSSKSLKLVASATAITSTSNMDTIGIDPNSTASHTLSFYAYNGTSGSIGGTVSSSIVKPVWEGTAIGTATYTDMGGGWWRVTYAVATTDATNEYGVEAQVSKTVYIDGVQLEALAYATTYTDGTLGTGYAWSGTAHESTSSRTVVDLDYVTSSNIAASAGSFSGWIKTPWAGNDSLAHTIFDTDTSAGTLKLSKNSSNNIALTDGTNTATKAVSWSANTWQHIVGTWTSGTLQVYVNGTAGTSASFSAPTLSTSLYLGQDKTNANLLNGAMSDIRIFDTALSSTQVTDLYKAGQVGHAEQYQVDYFSNNKGQSPVSIYHMDEGYGTTVYDSTVQANNLTLGSGASAPTWTVATGGNTNPRNVSLKFDGSNDYVSRTYDSDFDVGTDSFSLSGWFRHPSTISGQDTILARYGSAGYKVYMNSSGYLCFGIDDDSTWGPDDSACSTTSYADSKWHTFTAVKTSTTSIALYVDGVSVGSDSSLAATATLNPGSSISLYLGIDSDFTSNPWDGYLDEFYFYPYARSAAQAKADASALQSGGTLGAQTDDPLSNGLVGYWKTDELTGTTIADSSGNTSTGTLGTGSSAPSWTSGKFGASLFYDGTDDSVSVGSQSIYDDLLAGIQGFTTAAWVKPNLSGTGNITSKTDNSSGGWKFAIGANVAINMTVYTSDGAKNATATYTFSSSNWYHVVATYNKSTDSKIHIYVNGVELSYTTQHTIDSATIGTDASSDLMISSYTNAPATYFKGNIDETRVYNRALSAGEIQQLYAFAPGPVGYWKLDEKRGSTGYDSSGTGNNLTKSGSKVSYVVGKYGDGASYLADSNSNFQITNASQTRLNITGPITVETWVNIASTSCCEFDPVSKGLYNLAGVTNLGYRLKIDSSSVPSFLVSANGTSTETAAAASAISLNTWTHIAGIYDGSSVKIYVNGVLKASTSYSSGIYNSTGDFRIGGLQYDGGGGQLNDDFPTSVDDVRIYNYARTQKQIVEDMNAGDPLGGSPVGSQVAYWRMDEGYGTNVNDTTDNNNDLTMSTASWTNSGKFGKAWNGTGALWMSRADDADLDFTATEDFSISGWIKTDSATNPGSVEYIVNKASATVAGYAVYFNTSGNLCFGIDDDTTWGPDVASCTGTDVYDASWHHFVGARDTATDKTYIYVDGTQRDSDTDPTTATLANSQIFYVGDRDGTDNGSEFNGDIDEVKVYRGTLAPSELKVDYNQGSSVVLGALSDNSSYDKQAANQEYCVPGDTTSCAAPVGEWKLDEATGTSANDTSGNGNTGTLGTGSSAPSWKAGKYSAGLSFDGSDDYVSITDSTSLNWSQLTLSAWIYANDNTESGIISKGLNSGSTMEYGLIINSTNKPRFFIDDNGSWGPIVGSADANNIPTGRWVHLAGTYDGSATRLYVDGVLVDSDSYASTVLNSTGAVNIGTFYSINGADCVGGSTCHFNGKIDNVKIYNYARTAAQVAWDYNQGKPVGHWRMDECNGSSAYDSSGNSNTGTITIGATGTQTAVGNCTSGNSAHAWYNGVAGKFNGSLNFDGTDDYIIGTDQNYFSPSANNVSISAWVYIPAGASASGDNACGGTGRYFIGKGNTSNYEWGFENDNNTKLCFTQWPLTGASKRAEVSITRTMNDGAWHHYIAVVQDGTSIVVYVDGTQQGSTISFSSTAGNGTQAVTIGQRGDGNYYSGQIDDVRIFNYALTPVQIKTVYNENSAVRYGPSSGQP